MFELFAQLEELKEKNPNSPQVKVLQKKLDGNHILYFDNPDDAESMFFN